MLLKPFTLRTPSLVFLFFFSFIVGAFAQNGKSVSGTLKDSTGLSIISASIRLTSPLDTVAVMTDDNGHFSFANVKSNSFKLQASSLGYKTAIRTVTFPEGKNSLVLTPIILAYSAEVLGEVVVKAGQLITMKEDTIEYNARDYRVRPNALAEELIKKLDGVEVDKDGNISSMGESVSRIRVNGKDFFGGDIKTATKNLPADIIDKIQIIDDYGDQANLTGNKTGDPEKVLNIVIPPEKNKGHLGNIGIGAGTEDRYQLSGMYRVSNNKTTFSAIGGINNNNNQAFDFNTRGSGARRMPGSMGRAGGGGFGGFGGGSNGLTQSSSIGFDFRTEINDKITTYGNYSYNHSDNSTISSSEVTDNYEVPLFTSSQSTNKAISNNHRFDWTMEYKITPKTFLKLTPSVSFANNNSDARTDQNAFVDSRLNSNLLTTNLGETTDPNYNISGLINQKLNDKGRNIFLNFSLNSSETKNDQDYLNQTIAYGTTANDTTLDYQRQLIDSDNKNINGGISLSYLEPLSSKSNMEITYDYNFATYDNLRETNLMVTETGTPAFSPELSNDFTYKFLTHKIGFNYNYRAEKIIFSAGLGVMPTLLSGETNYLGEHYDTGRKGFYVVPNFRFEYKVSSTRSLTLNYTGTAAEPSFSQLQPVLDVSNPLNTTQGNPNLAAAFHHQLRFRYRNFDFQKKSGLFAMVNAQFTEDQIVSRRVQSIDTLNRVVQNTSYVNDNGYYTVNGFYSYSIPFNERSFVASARGRAGYTNNISYASPVMGEDPLRNIAGNWVLSQSFDLQINPKKATWLDIRPGASYTYNTTSNSLESVSSNTIKTWTASFNANITLLESWLIGGDLNKDWNSGYGGTVGANPFIVNTFIEKQFLTKKNLLLRLSGFDLLNQQTSISRTVSGNTIRDSRNNRLARYFMLSLTYRFQKFGGKSGAEAPFENNGDFRPPGAPGERPRF